MIALAAHEEEGPREVCEGAGPSFGRRREDSRVAEGPLRASGAGSCGAEEVCGARPAGAFMEELRLGLLSACAGVFNRERFPAG